VERAWWPSTSGRRIPRPWSWRSPGAGRIPRKEAALFVYPFESHTSRAIENNLDMWARWLVWFDTYVKGAPGALPADDGEVDGDRREEG
jgi:hypothetical protein